MYIHDRIDPNENFRERRRRGRRRRRIRHAAVTAVLLGLVAGIVLGATWFTREGPSREATSTPVRRAAPIKWPLPRVPSEIRGLHLTMGLASVSGKLDEYFALRAYGLNTIELDIKDENGYVGFESPLLPALAGKVEAPRPFYDAFATAEVARKAGIYLIGRLVVFEDPTLVATRPDLAIQRPDGSVWSTTRGQGWSNPYDRRVWRYNVDIAVAAAKAGFDEIQFDYVRFPSDGEVEGAVYPGKRSEPRGKTIERFMGYAARRLRPLRVRVSADLFGLAATRDLGIGQVPRLIGRHVDAVYPMVYPSHYNDGEYNLVDPEAFPGRTVANSLLDFKRQLKGQKVRIVPWLQDFSSDRFYGLIEVAEQVAAARKQRAGGFLLWNPLGIYNQEALSGPRG